MVGWLTTKCWTFNTTQQEYRRLTCSEHSVKNKVYNLRAIQQKHTHNYKMSSGSSSIPRMIKKKHFRVKHQKVKLFRANEPILSVFMWGINHTVCFVICLIYIGHFCAFHVSHVQITSKAFISIWWRAFNVTTSNFIDWSEMIVSFFSAT